MRDRFVEDLTSAMCRQQDFYIGGALVHGDPCLCVEHIKPSSLLTASPGTGLRSLWSPTVGAAQ
jgi:hypothetical protein